MGYFSNGSEGEDYQAKYCARCVHENMKTGRGCPIWNLHLLHNYDDCNNPKSYLHFLIPRDHEKCGNERCTMFVDRGLLSNLALEKFEHDALSSAK